MLILHPTSIGDLGLDPLQQIRVGMYYLSTIMAIFKRGRIGDVTMGRRNREVYYSVIGYIYMQNKR